MRRTLLRGLTATVLSIGMILPMTAVPAQADVLSVVGVLKTVYGLYEQFIKGGSGGLTLNQAVQEINTEIQASQTAIIDEIDLVAAANVKACATSAVINFADINALTRTNLQAFALDTTSCVTQAQSLIDALTDKAAIDEVGFAMNTVGPLALMARIKAGLTTPALKSVLVSGENALITHLLPTCDQNDLAGGEPGSTPILVWLCTAYNGHVGTQSKSLTVAQDSATSNTSRAVAQAVLPDLI
jgi:hypothetical protein